jgi:hypothetical protein
VNSDDDYNNEEEQDDLNDDDDVDDEEEVTDELDEVIDNLDDVFDSFNDRSQSYTDESQTSSDDDDDDDDEEESFEFRWQKIASVSVHDSKSFNKSKSVESDQSNKMHRSQCLSEEGEEVVIEEIDEEEEDVDEDEDNNKEDEEGPELEEEDESDSTDSSMPTIPSVLHTTMSKEVLSGYRPKNDKYTRTSTTGRIDMDDVIDSWKSIEKQLQLGGVGASGEADEKEQHSVKFCDDVTLPPVDLDELRAVLERDDKGEIERLYDAIVKSRTTIISEESESESTSDDNDSKASSSSKLQSKDDITTETSNYIEVVGSIETYDSLASKICKIEHLVDCYASLEGASTLLTTMDGSLEDVDDDGRQPHKDVVAEVQSELTQRLLTNNAVIQEAEKVEEMPQKEVKTKKKVEKFARSKRPSGIFKVVADVQSELTQRLLTNNSAVREEKTGRMKAKKKVGGIFESAAAFVVTGKYRKNTTTKMEQPSNVVLAAVTMKSSDIVVNVTPLTMPPPSPSIEPSIVNDSPTNDEGKQVMNTSTVNSLPRTHSMTSAADTACTNNGVEVEGISRNKSFQPFRDKDNVSTTSSRLREKVNSHKKDEIVEPDRPSLHLSRLITVLDSEEDGSLWDDDISRKSKTPKRLILEDGAIVPSPRPVESPKIKFLFEDSKIVTKKSPRGGVNRKSSVGASPSSRRMNGYNLSTVSEDKECVSPTNSALVKSPAEGKPVNHEKIQSQEKICEETSIKKNKRKSGSFTDTFPPEKFVDGKKEESESVKSLEVKIKPVTIVDNHIVSTTTPEIEVAGERVEVKEQQHQQQQQQQHGIANIEKEQPQTKKDMKRFMSPIQSLPEKQQVNGPLKKKTLSPIKYFRKSQSTLLSKSKGFIATVIQDDSGFIAKARNKDTLSRPVVKSGTHNRSISTETESHPAPVKTPSEVIKVAYTPRSSKIGSPRMMIHGNEIIKNPKEKILPDINDKVELKSTATIEIRTVDARDDNPDELSFATNHKKSCDEKREGAPDNIIDSDYAMRGVTEDDNWFSQLSNYFTDVSPKGDELKSSNHCGHTLLL